MEHRDQKSFDLHIQSLDIKCPNTIDGFIQRHNRYYIVSHARKLALKNQKKKEK